MFLDKRVKEGSWVLLHVGKKLWHDLEAPKAELLYQGYSREEGSELSSLPQGYKAGEIVAIIKLGKTRLSSEEERKTDEVRRAVVAKYENIGRYLTEVSDAKWLLKPFSIKGAPNIFEVSVPIEIIPP